MSPAFDRNDMGPILSGLVIGDVLGDLALGGIVSGGSYLSFAAALIYIGFLVRDTVQLFRRPL